MEAERAANGCSHRWMLPPPGPGAEDPATCAKCGAQRVFRRVGVDDGPIKWARPLSPYRKAIP